MEIKILLGVFSMFVLSNFNHVQAGAIEQSRSMMLDTYDGRILRNISKRSPQRGSWYGGNSYGRGSGRGSRRSGESSSGSITLAKFQSNCKSCGHMHHSKRGRVVGGDDVNPPYKYPWMTRLQYASDGQIFCSGSLISESFVLTAAHCLVKRGDYHEIYKKLKSKLRFSNPEDIQVGFTTESTKNVKLGPPVQKVIPHPEFSLSHMKHDIALLKLKHQITCNEFQNPICLPPANYELPKGMWLQLSGWGATIFEGPVAYLLPSQPLLTQKTQPFALLKLKRQITCNEFQNRICLPPANYGIPKGTWMQLSGWGATAFEGPPSDELKQAPAKNVEFSKCAAEKFPTYLKDQYYCLQNHRQQSSYSGDSGGPLFNKLNLFKDGLAYVLGVASQEARYNGDEPFLFTAVPKHMEWITEVIGLSTPKKNNIESGFDKQTTEGHQIGTTEWNYFP